MSNERPGAKPLNDAQIRLGAAFASYVLGRNWFDHLLEADEQPVARLLLGIFACFERGILPTKTQAMKFLNAVDARTSHRYIKIAEDKELLVVRPASYDRRVNLLCPTDRLIELVKKEIDVLMSDIEALAQAVQFEGERRTDVSWRRLIRENRNNRFLTTLGGAETLVSEQEVSENNIHESTRREIVRFSETLRYAPTNKVALKRRADIYLFSFASKEAIADYTALLKSDPDDPDIYARRAEAYSNEEALENSLADLDKAIELAPARTDLRIDRAETLIELNQPDRAIQDLTKAIKVESSVDRSSRFASKHDLIRAFHVRASAYKAIGRLIEAAADLEASKVIEQSGEPQVLPVDKTLLREPKQGKITLKKKPLRKMPRKK